MILGHKRQFTRVSRGGPLAGPQPCATGALTKASMGNLLLPGQIGGQGLQKSGGLRQGEEQGVAGPDNEGRGCGGRVGLIVQQQGF